jgi:hypothetical protein
LPIRSSETDETRGSFQLAYVNFGWSNKFNMLKLLYNGSYLYLNTVVSASLAYYKQYIMNLYIEAVSPLIINQLTCDEFYERALTQTVCLTGLK